MNQWNFHCLLAMVVVFCFLFNPSVELSTFSNHIDLAPYNTVPLIDKDAVNGAEIDFGDEAIVSSSVVSAPLYSVGLGQDPVVNLTLDRPLELSVCGPPAPICITVESDSALTNVKGIIILPNGLEVSDLTAKIGTAFYIPGTDTIQLSDIPEAGSVSFALDLEADCDMDMSNTDYSFQVFFDTLCVGGKEMEGGTSSFISIQEADISNPSASPTLIEAYAGLSTSISVNIANAGNGELDTFYYCVQPHPSATLTSVQVGGLSLTAAPASVEPGFDCYYVTSTEIMAALGVPVFVDDNLDVIENWTFVDCEDDSDIVRRAQYGCNGNFDCRDKSINEFVSTGVIFGAALPDIQATSISQSRPSCYTTSPTQSVVQISNSGTSPAVDISWSIDGNGGAIDLSSYSVIHNIDGNITSTIEIQNAADPCVGGISSITDSLFSVNLDPGETLTVSYEVNYDCACNDCSIRDIYDTGLSVEHVTDLCGDDINTTASVSFTPGNAYIDGFAEAPIDLLNGDIATMEYTINSMELDWLNGIYPDSYLESAFEVPCGLDFVPGSAQFVDRNGLVYPFCSETVTDSGGPAVDPDTILVRWCVDSLPTGFVIGSGAYISFDVLVDCSEKPAPMDCSNPTFDVVVGHTTYFSTDSNCAISCERQKIWEAGDLDIRIFCPGMGGCPCVGMLYTDFSIERSSFGLGDANNDQIPDSNVNPDSIQLDRFIQGDTLIAVFQGRITGTSPTTPWTYGYATIDFDHSEYIPLGVEVFIRDIDVDTTDFICSAVPVSIDPVTNDLVIDFSIQSLNNLGCGIDSSFTFEDTDSIRVQAYFKIKQEFSGQQQMIIYDSEFYVSEAERGIGTQYQCNDRRARLTQIGLTESLSASVGNFGACDLPNWTYTYNRHIGSTTFDEFNKEIRPLGLPQELIFNKPPEFEWRLDQFRVQLTQRIPSSNNIVNGIIPESYLFVNDTTVTFYAESYFNSLGNLEIPPDEGYRMRFYPRIQGSCLSVAGSYDISAQLTESVISDIYCTTEITRILQQNSFTYTGGARIEIATEVSNVRLCAATDTVGIIVSSTNPPTAVNSFLRWQSVDGSVVVTKIIERSSGMEITPNNFGVFELGDIPGGSSRSYDAFIRANACVNGLVQFIAGWDCETYPTTSEEAICTDPSSISFTNAGAAVNIDPISPLTDTLVPLCTEVPFEVEMRSTDLGYARDLKLYVQLPIGTEYISGTLEMAYVSRTLGGTYVPQSDPQAIPGGFFVDVSNMNQILSDEGLIGSKDQDRNKVSVRFRLNTTCDYINGGRLSYSLTANNNCGEPLEPVTKLSTRLNVTNTTPDFDADVTLEEFSLNSCSQEISPSYVTLQLTNGAPEATIDSIQYILPPGLTYVPGTYVPFVNASPMDPVVDTINGSERLLWPFNAMLGGGDIISFKIDIQAIDVGQLCTESFVRVQAFTKINESCGMSTCSIGILAGEAFAGISIEKPQLKFSSFNADLSLISSTDEALSVFDVTICNEGATLQSGEKVLIEIYEDVDRNGSRTPADTLLFEIERVLDTPLEPYDCISLSGSETFPSGTVCTIIGVLNPETTCTCSEEPSFQVMPMIHIDFNMELEICSDDLLDMGPDPVDDYAYEWLSYNGSPLSALVGGTTVSPTQFMLPNTTGSPLEYQYILRSSTANCYVFDTVSITLHPERMDVFNLQACMGTPYNLPSVNVGGSGFNWSSISALSFPGPDSSFAVLENPLSDTTITLTYNDPGGCSSSAVYNITVINCGIGVAALGDTVWFDFNRDGIFDIGEPGISGMVVNLYDANNGSLIATTTTDVNGFYNFGNLVQGNYQVEFIPLDGFVGTLANEGSGPAQDSLDSDADPVTGLTPSYLIQWGEYDETIDAGFVPDCLLDVDLNITPCYVQADTITNRLDIRVVWDNNPHTYDQFGTDELTLAIPSIGYTNILTIDTLLGDTTLTVYYNPDSDISVQANAAFLLADLCIDSSDVITLGACMYDLALKKEASNGSNFAYGDTICLDIVIENQGAQSVQNVEVIDYLPEGFGFISSLNPDWYSSGDYIKSTITDTLSEGEFDTIPLKVSLLMTDGDLNAWTNYAEITSFQDTLGNDRSPYDVDSTPDEIVDNDAGGLPNSPSDDYLNGNGLGAPGGTDAGTDEDDHDPFTVEIFDLALRKTITTPPPYNYGQTVDFVITVFNQGNTDAYDVEIGDYVPGGYTWNTGNEPTWMYTPGGAAPFDLATTVLNGLLAVGDSTSVTLSLDLTDAAADQYVNVAEISSAKDEDSNLRYDDFDSQPDADAGNDAGGSPGSNADNAINGNGTGAIGEGTSSTDEDDADPAYVAIPLIDLTKRVTDLIPASSGVDGNFDATFELVITNTGNQKLTNLLLQDDLIEQLGASFVGITTVPTIVPISNPSDTPSVVMGYNGGVIDSIFNGTDGCLDIDEVITLEMVVEVTGMNGPEPIINEATVSGRNSFNTVVMDMDTALVAVPECFMSITCPNPNQGIFECLEEIPAAANSLNAFNAIDGFSQISNFCDTLTITSLDTDNGGMGCVGDTLIITRIYYIIDSGASPIGAEMDSCTVTYTVVDDVKPIIMISPSDLTVDCSQAGSATTISNWVTDFGGARIMENCPGGLIESFVPTGTLIVECGGAFTQEYTYTAADSCGNSISEVAYLQNLGLPVPAPQFNIPSSICWDGNPDSLTIIPDYSASQGVTSSWTITQMTLNEIDSLSGNLTINESGSFEICVDEILISAPCATAPMDTCSRQYCQTIIITNNATLDPSWNTPGTYCLDQNSPVSLNALVTGDTSGIFSGPGVVGSHPNYSFRPDIAGVGNHIICYTINSTSGCSAVQCATIEVYPAANASLNDIALDCQISSAGQFSLSGLLSASSTPNGSFTYVTGGNGQVVGGSVLQYNQPGCYEVAYVAETFSGASGACIDMDTAYILIPEQPVPSFTIQDAVCLSAGDADVILPATLTSPSYFNSVTRTWSLDTDNLVNATATVAVDGSVTISPGGGDVSGSIWIILQESIASAACGTSSSVTCMVSDSARITVEDGSSIDACFTVNELNPCIGDTIVFTANTAGGIFSGTGVVDDGNGSTGMLVITDCGPHLITYTISSPNGCSNSCSINVFNEETEPVIMIPANAVFYCDGSGNTTDVNSWLSGISANADCGDPFVSTILFNTISSCGNGQTLIYQTTAIDECGNESVAYGEISIVDTLGPILNVPSDITLNCDDLSSLSSITATLDTWKESASASDICGGLVAINTDFDIATIDVCSTADYMISVAFIASDECGNQTVDTARINIEVDDLDPVLSVPSDITIDCASLGSGDASFIIDSLVASASVSDNCDSEVALTHSYDSGELDLCAAATYDIEIVFTATDGCGNTSMDTTTITVVPDVTAPVITRPSDITIDCTSLGSGDASFLIDSLIASASVSDNCDSEVVLTHSYDSGELDLCSAATYDIEIVFTATDGCGNTSMDTTTITVVPDVTAPVITRPLDITIDCASLGSGDASFIIDSLIASASVSDNCDSEVALTHSYDSGELDLCAAATYDIEIVFTATDGCGNTSMDTTTITVVPDVTAPVITRPSDLTIDCASLGSGDASFLIDSLIASASVSDNCDSEVALTHSYDSGELDLCSAATYDIEIVFTATDGCGNTSMDTTTITVVPDVTAPIITRPSDLTIDCASLGSGDASFLIDSLIASASVSDNCDSEVALTHSYDSGELDLCSAATYDIEIVFTATDGCGNTSMDTTTITVVPDVTAPVITRPSDITIDCTSLGSGDASFIIDSLVASASVSDNCDSDVTMSHNYNSAQLDLCASSTYEIEIEFTATDGCGNTSLDTTTITIVPDVTAPVITRPSDITIDCASLGSSDASFIIDSLVASASVSDNCDSDVTMSHNYNSAQLDLCASSTYEIEIEFTATDGCGNTSLDTTTITIVPDVTAPVITRPSDITIDCASLGSGDASFIIDSLVASASVSDNCDSDVTMSHNYNSAQLDLCASSTYEIEIEFTATDGCGNTSLDTTTITIVPDVTAPTVVCCADFSIPLDPSGVTILDINDFDCGTFDNCTDELQLNRYLYRTIGSTIDNGINGQSFELTENDIGVNAISLVAVDACGNADTCTVLVTLTEAGSLGVAKREVSVNLGEDGCTEVVYELNIENFGNVNLDSIQVSDNLVAAGYAACGSYTTSLTSDDFTVNPNYNGSTDTTLLQGGDDLPVGDAGAILLTVEACGCPDGSVISNSATATGDTPAGDELTDDSVDGSDPDGTDGDDDPDESSNTFTNLNFGPSIGIAKRVALGPMLREDGCFDLAYELKVKNLGNLPISNIQVLEDINLAFAASDSFVITGVFSEEFDISVDYDGGVTDARLLTGRDTLNVQLGEGEEGSIIIELIVCSDEVERTYKNQAMVSGVASNQQALSDASHDGSDPDPDGNGPLDNNEPTLVTMQINPKVDLKKRISEGPFDNGDGTFDLTYELRVENSGDVPILIASLTDDLETTFADAVAWEIIRLESAHFEINRDYDGIDELNLLNKPEIMNVSDAGAVYIGIRVTPGADEVNFENTAFVDGQSFIGNSLFGASLSGGSSVPSILVCTNTIICPIFPDTIVQENDAGWCFATVNIPLALPDTCTGTGPIQFEYILTGSGAKGLENDVWLPGQPSGLQYYEGLTEAMIRYSFDNGGSIGYSDTCTLYVDVIDKEAPILMAGLPEDMTLQSCAVWDTFHLQQHHIADNCPDSLYIFEEVISTKSDDPFDCQYYNYTDTLKWTVTDSSRVTEEGVLLNVSIWKQLVYWEDTTAPDIIVPPDITVVECLPDTTFNVIGFDTIPVDTVPTPFELDDGTWVTLNVVIKDTIPIIDTLLNDNSYGTALAIDECAPDSVMSAMLAFRDSVVVFCKGDKEAIIHRIWSVADPCGNRTERIQRITILDKNPPEIECVQNITLSLDDNGRRILTKDDVLISVSNACYDNTANAEIRIEPNVFGCGDIGVHRVIVSATDLCGGETSYCEVEVTIIDDTPPILNCPVNPIIIDQIPENCEVDLAALNDILVHSDCDVTITTSPPLFDGGLTPGLHTVTVTAVDASGNMASCDVDIDVQVTLDLPESIACLSRVNLALGPDCTASVSPEMLFLGPAGICPNFLCVDIFDASGNPHANFFNETDDGQEFTVQINDCNGSENACWGTVRVEMKTSPDIDWPKDVELLCVEPTEPSYHKNGVPVALNCVDGWYYNYQDTYLSFDRCDIPRATIVRIWTVFDQFGYEQLDTQYIYILPYSNEHILWPNDIRIEKPLECGEVDETIDDIENGVLPLSSRVHPDSTGRPNLFGIPLSANAGVCLFAIGYEDRVLEICEGSYQILREWEINDVCSEFKLGENPVSHTQIITVFDTKEPELISGPDTLIYSINPWTCTFTGEIPYAQVEEDCSFVSLEAYVSGGGYMEVTRDDVTNEFTTTGIKLTLGSHRMTNIFKDACGNITIYHFTVKIFDGVPPVAIARESISSTLTYQAGGTGETKILVSSIDAGSHDAFCSEIRTCILLNEELNDPIIINGKQATDDNGNLLYVAHQCAHDGVFEYEYTIGKDRFTEEIPYVICKDFVKFCCQDIGENTVALVVSDEQGNTSTSWTIVRIEDKSASSLACTDTFISCGDDYSVESIGKPTFTGGGCLQTELSHKDVEDLNSCGIGTIERNWYIDSSFICTQMIYVADIDKGFDPKTIKWPVHYDGITRSGIRRECIVVDTTADHIEIYGIQELEADIDVPDAFDCEGMVHTEPSWCSTSCALVQSSFEDEEVAITESCQKIIRHWTIIDWCVYQPNSGEDEIDHNIGEEEFELVDDVWLGEGDWLTTLDTAEMCLECDHQIGTSELVYYRYDIVVEDGYYTFDQIIKIVDDAAPIISAPDTVVVEILTGANSKEEGFENCFGRKQITASVSDFCGGLAVDASNVSWTILISDADGDEIETNLEIADSISLFTPYGNAGETYTVSWKVSDGCGNESATSSVILYKDEKVPTPICKQDISTALMSNNGSVTIWATDFDQGSFDNCSEVEMMFRDDFGNFVPSILLTCSDLNEGVATTVQLEIYAVDEAGNYDHCIAQLRIDDNNEACPDGNVGAGMISGEIRTESGITVDQTNVNLSQGKEMMTASDGMYYFNNNPFTSDYLIAPAKMDEPTNGVTALDIILIQRHLVGLAELEGPYKIVAADVNNDQKITATDVVQIRKLLLGVDTSFLYNSSWRFVDADQYFDYHLHPWPLSELRQITDLKSDMLYEDFIGIKIGDVNSSAIANSAFNASGRAQDQLTLVAEEQFFEEGEIVMVPLKISNTHKLQAMQYTLHIEGLEYLGYYNYAQQLAAEEIAHLNEKTVTMVWDCDHQTAIPEFRKEDTLIVLGFQALSKGRLSHSLELNSSATRALAYDDLSKEFDVQLFIEDSPLNQEHIILYQNEPNPFEDQSIISFYLPSRGEAQISVFDIYGKLIFEHKEFYEYGFNSIEINKSDLGVASGVLNYRLESNGKSVSKRMILVR